MDRLVDTFFGVDTELLHQADQVLAKHGITLQEAIVAVLEQIVHEQKPPAVLTEAAGPQPDPDVETVGEEFEAAVQNVARGSVFTSAEIKAYLQHMDEL